MNVDITKVLKTNNKKQKSSNYCCKREALVAQLKAAQLPYAYKRKFTLY